MLNLPAIIKVKLLKWTFEGQEPVFEVIDMGVNLNYVVTVTQAPKICEEYGYKCVSLQITNPKETFSLVVLEDDFNEAMEHTYA